MKKAVINVTVNCVPHTKPQRLIDVLARLILKEVLHQEAEATRITEVIPAVSAAQKENGESNP
ncbi:hypothetical protein [Paenibacillus wynnii]|uniref:Uncharacterized protein n=1 Tax=Paenibacillus wynnii TaxID=268407 RepID=A0A098M2M9_9BACL|nr:hypothetical protein [Paenibacillus wynnii]KGE16645.1 hypothetical protein PWYN_18235 [Paenibacillus wynnii]